MNANAHAAIGGFDSGLGGLWVRRAIREVLPAEDLLYLADSGYAPYGDRDEAFIVARSMAMCDFLVRQGAKAIVVACNTATVVAARQLRAQFGVPIVAMEPAIKPAVELTRSKVVGVLAARASIGVAEARRQLATEDRLYRSGAQSRQAVAAARASVSSSGAAAGAAFASARSSEAQVQELTEQLAKAEIKAPMDGVVTMIKVKPGEVAARGTRVARVFDPADLQVRFEVPRGHRAEFAVGAEVVVTLDGVERPLRAKVIDLSADLEAPLQFAVGVADIDDAGLSPDDGRVGASASVRVAAAAARASAGR